MIYDYIRVLKYNGSAFTDVSLANQDLDQTIDARLSTTDYFYIGQKCPFTNIYAWAHSTVNSIDADLTVQYWNGTEWVSAVDLLDGTKTGVDTLAKSGNIMWALDIDHNWQMIPDPTDANSPTEMQTLKIYNLYWIRIKASAQLSASTALKEITYAFTTTNQLNNHDIEINNYFPAFETGKTDWIKEIVTASKMVTLDLRAKGLLEHWGQLITYEDIHIATNYKCLELIYFSLGKNYDEKRIEVQKMYEKALSPKRLTIDENMSGRIDSTEQNNIIRTLKR